MPSVLSSSRALRSGTAACFTLFCLAALASSSTGCKRSEDSGARAESNVQLGSAPVDFAGSYTIAQASNPGGAGTYNGAANINRNGEVHSITWIIANSPGYSGVALSEGNTLGVGWGMGKRYGVVVYRIQADKLVGRWATADSGPTPGTEELSGSPNLEGNYTIVSAKTPKGGTYSGSVSITPNGDTYTVQWVLKGAEGYTGVGIREGDLFIVGWGEAGKGAGVVSYQKNGNSLVGKWAAPGSRALGKETLNKN